MKAKEYSERFNSNPTATVLAEIWCDFDKETTAIVRARGVKRDSAFKAVLNEMDLKWQAFARLTNGAIRPDGYRIIMRKLHPETAAFAWPE